MREGTIVHSHYPPDDPETFYVVVSIWPSYCKIVECGREDESPLFRHPALLEDAGNELSQILADVLAARDA